MAIEVAVMEAAKLHLDVDAVIAMMAAVVVSLMGPSLNAARFLV